MKKHFVLSALLICCTYLQAQYYFNDIVSLKSNENYFEKLMAQQIRLVSVKAYETDNTEASDFYLKQEVNPLKKTLTTSSKSSSSDASILETTFDAQGRIQQVFDSSQGGSNYINYRYNASNQLVEMKSRALEQAQQQNIVNERREYFYNEKGMPEKMIRINGSKDTMVVEFIASQNQQPGEEQWWKNGMKIETWFYYYDDANRLTDIVRYNQAVKKMLPDYLFGYDDEGMLTSKIAVQPVTGSFRIWQYQYNVQGLKIKETVMNKERQPEGKLLYTYQ